MFLTFAWYAERWWEVLDGEDECTPEERESILLNTLATLQFEFLTDLNATTDHCLFNQNKEATSAEVSAGRGDDTTPIEEESA